MNFFSEGNSIINYEKENEKRYYYDKHIDDMHYCYSEINKKNKQIIQLKTIISNLKITQEKLLSEIKALQNKNLNYSSKQKIKTNEPQKNSQEFILLSKIKKLQRENSKLKMRLNNSEEKENIFYKNINNKLLKAERDIQKLSFENKNNNNIILAIQNFLFNVNDKLNPQKQPLIFDLSLVDNDTFIHNLQILELNIITKINQLNNIGNMCLYNSRNNNNKKIIYDNNYIYDENHHTINGNNAYILQNLKKNLKVKGKMKTINYLNSKNIISKKKFGFGLFYNNFFDSEKQKNSKPLKAYSLRNNFFKEIGINDDINFENKDNIITNGKEMIKINKKE